MIDVKNYRDILSAVKSETDDFTKASGHIQCTDKGISETVIDILERYYNIVDWGIDDIQDKPDGDIYVVLYNDSINDDGNLTEDLDLVEEYISGRYVYFTNPEEATEENIINKYNSIYFENIKSIEFIRDDSTFREDTSIYKTDNDILFRVVIPKEIETESLLETIVKRDDGYYVKSEKNGKDGHKKNLGGPYPTLDKAKDRLAQVEKFKHMNKEINEGMSKKYYKGRVSFVFKLYFNTNITEEEGYEIVDNIPGVDESEIYDIGDNWLEIHSNMEDSVGYDYSPQTRWEPEEITVEPEYDWDKIIDYFKNIPNLVKIYESEEVELYDDEDWSEPYDGWERYYIKKNGVWKELFFASEFKASFNENLDDDNFKLHHSLKEDIPTFWEWVDDQGLDPDVIEDNPDLEEYFRQQYDITYNFKTPEDYDLLDTDVPDDYDDFDFYPVEKEEPLGYHFVCYYEDDDSPGDQTGDAETLDDAIKMCKGYIDKYDYDCAEIFGPKGDTVATFWEGKWNTDYGESLTEKVNLSRDELISKLKTRLIDKHEFNLVTKWPAQSEYEKPITKVSYSGREPDIITLHNTKWWGDNPTFKEIKIKGDDDLVNFFTKYPVTDKPLMRIVQLLAQNNSQENIEDTNESLHEDKLKFSPNYDPAGTPLGKGTGLGESSPGESLTEDPEADNDLPEKIIFDDWEVEVILPGLKYDDYDRYNDYDRADGDKLVEIYDRLADVLEEDYGVRPSDFNWYLSPSGKIFIDNIYWFDDVDESLTEDTIKQNGKWVNKGKEGTHGEFKTKKAADRQRRAMFRNGYKGESLTEAKNDTYVRVTIDGKGFFLEADKIYKKLFNSDDYSEQEDGDKINEILCRLEYELPFPEISDKKIIFAYKDSAFTDEIKEELQNLKDILSYYGHKLEITNIYPSKIKYEDDFQIGYLPEGLNINEAKNDTLNPAIWENNELKPEVKEKLQLIADKFIEKLKEDDIPVDVDDIVIVGSNRNYNYGPQSDIDLHIIADLSQFKGREKELAEKIYQCKKSIFNDKYDPMINGYEVELYVEPKE